MKKTLQIACLIMLFPITLLSQRNVDVNSILIKPAKGDVIYKNVSFFIRIDFKNEGPGNMLTGDTIYFQFKIFGQVIGQQDKFKLPNDLAPTETYNFILPSYAIGFSSSAENTPFCAETSIINQADPIIDPNNANNSPCNNVNLRNSASINDHQNNSNVAVYPNPAQYIFFIKTDEPNQATAELILSDLSGKVCLHQTISTFGQITATSINLPALPKGLYLLQIKTDTQLISQPIYIHQ